jgi:hypothetical protein
VATASNGQIRARLLPNGWASIVASDGTRLMTPTEAPPSYGLEWADTPAALWPALTSADLSAVRRLVPGPPGAGQRDLLSAKLDLGWIYAFGYGQRYGHIGGHHASPLHVAVYEAGGNPKKRRTKAALAIVRHLVACGASATLKDGWGYTAGGEPGSSGVLSPAAASALREALTQRA